MKKLLIGLMLLSLLGCVSGTRTSIKHDAFVPKNEICVSTGFNKGTVDCYSIKPVMGLKVKTIYDLPDGLYRLQNDSGTKLIVNGKEDLDQSYQHFYITIEDNVITMEEGYGDFTIKIDKSTKELIEISDKKIENIIKSFFPLAEFPSVSSGDVVRDTFRIYKEGLTMTMRMENLVHGIIIRDNKPHIFMEVKAAVSARAGGNYIKGKVRGYIISDIENLSIGTTHFNMSFSNKVKIYTINETSIENMK